MKQPMKLPSMSELLLPVGNLEMAMAAIHNGADAIYLGFPFFNARGRSKDFSMEELKEIIQFCHLYGVRVNLALNILIFENEFPRLMEILPQVLALGPDSLIVQDLGVAQLVRQINPQQNLHASTQMTISNADAIHFLQDLNFRRIVLARENSIPEMQMIRASTDKELEVFVHGALCVSYSGQCFTSETLGGRSANRGQCAQSCRFAYELIVDGKKQTDLDEQYLVSPQDLCGIEEIPQLMDLGINTFKVEGRLKSAEYVASVAQSYRQVMDSYLNQSSLIQSNRGSILKNDKSDFTELKNKMEMVYSRGFFSGWLHGVDHQQLVDGTYSAHRGLYLGKIEAIKNGKLILKKESLKNATSDQQQEIPLVPGDGLLWVLSKAKTDTIDNGHVISRRVNNGRADNQRESTEFGGMIYDAEKLKNGNWSLGFSNDIQLHDYFIGSTVYLNSKKDLIKELNQTYQNREKQKKIPVVFDVELKLNQPLKVQISDGLNRIEKTTEEFLQLAKSKCITESLLHEEFAALGGTAFVLQKINLHKQEEEEEADKDKDNVKEQNRQQEIKYFIPHSQIKNLRRQLTQSLSELRSQSKVDSFHLTNQVDSDISNLASHTENAQKYFQETKFKNNQSASMSSQENPTVGQQQTAMNILLRDKEQVEDFVQFFSQSRHKNKIHAVILDFEFGRDYATAVLKLKENSFPVGIATTRILKPQEYNNLKYIHSLKPDFILARNLGAIWYLKNDLQYSGKILGDFSLNVTNHLSAKYLLEKNINSLCLSYDMNVEQIQDLLSATDPSRMEINVHQYMPSFHMEHCVFAAFLSQGSSYRDCGKPCEKHQVELKDQFGHYHQIKPDQECRNTMFHAVPQSAARFIPQWSQMGLGFVRLEALKERGSELTNKIQAYLSLLAGEITSEQLYQEVKVFEKYGLAEGNLVKSKEYISRKKE